MLDEKDIDKIPLKEPTRDIVWMTHSTLEQIRLLRDRNPIIYKAMRHCGLLNEDYTPIEFFDTTSSMETAIYFAGEGTNSIDFSIFTEEELLDIEKHADLRIEEYQAYIAGMKHSLTEDSVTLEIFNDTVESLKKHVDMLRNIIGKKREMKPSKKDVPQGPSND